MSFPVFPEHAVVFGLSVGTLPPNGWMHGSYVDSRRTDIYHLFTTLKELVSVDAQDGTQSTPHTQRAGFSNYSSSTECDDRCLKRS